MENDTEVNNSGTSNWHKRNTALNPHPICILFRTDEIEWYLFHHHRERRKIFSGRYHEQYRHWPCSLTAGERSRRTRTRIMSMVCLDAIKFVYPLGPQFLTG